MNKLNTNKKPELLAPAGDMEKLIIAINYGADAVYFGGQNYGLRAKSRNFGLEEMEKAVSYAHKHNCKAYVTANIFAHNSDFEGMEEYFKNVYKIGADALIISDPGVFMTARKTVPQMDIHISTQANNTNMYTAKFWHELGATRIVLARELSLNDIEVMRESLPEDFELEAFVHGAMCISYSGRCLLSNYMAERDGNKGECAHPCRWQFYLMEEQRPGKYMPVYEDERGTYIFNSKDLCMIKFVPEMVKAGIGSFKIEGRMKTPFYVATTIKAYRQAIDDYFDDPEKYEKNKHNYVEQLEKCSNRHYTTGFYFNKPSQNEQNYESSAYVRLYDFIGIVLEYDQNTCIATMEQRNKFSVGESVEMLRAKGETFKFTLEEMTDEVNNSITDAPHAKQIVKMKMPYPVEKYDILQRKGKEESNN